MEDYLKDIQDIRKMMDKSSQFLSLSGLSGVLAGIYALLGAYAVYEITQDVVYIIFWDRTFNTIVAIASAVLLLSVLTAYIMTARKTKKQGDKVWNSATRRMSLNFLIPLATGGIFSLLLINNQYYGLIAPVMLLFYGMACVNASKYTLRDVRYLGLTMIVIGLFAAYYIGYGLAFWALGFGVCHIIYGAVMYFKYDRN
ncbi:MAG: hypothetical protein EOO45_22205 [Flavobacterium sp.]|nr:MAG: hypothetical protein EOO45_22205 [Flavobacterium sp.]